MGNFSLPGNFGTRAFEDLTECSNILCCYDSERHCWRYFSCFLL